MARSKRTAEGDESGGAANDVIPAAPFGKAITRAFELLDLMPGTGGCVSFAELMELSGLSEASLYRILCALEHHQQVERNSNGAYRLAPDVARSRLYRRVDALRSAVHDIVQEITFSLNETCSLAFLFGDHIRVIDTAESFHEFRITNTKGRIVPPHASSLGKAITAYQQPAAVESILGAYGMPARTPRTIVDRRLLMQQFAGIAAGAVAEDDEETVLGGHCFGVPIFSLDGKVESAMSVSVPIARLTADRVEQVVARLRQGALDAAAAWKHQSEARGQLSALRRS